MTVVVNAESLTKRFGGISAVTDLSCALEAGTIAGFLGANGAGKTTTLRMSKRPRLRLRGAVRASTGASAPAPWRRALRRHLRRDDLGNL